MPQDRNNMREFLDILGDFDEAMLVTQRGRQLRSRPMAIADCTDDGRVRFVTRDDSGKLEELDENSNVNIAMQGEARYVSISGVAKLTKDRQLIDAVWERRHNPWFRHGKEDPHVIVLEVLPDCVEYWDRTDTNFVTRVVEEFLDTFRDDDDPVDDAGSHGRVEFSERRQ